MLILGFDQATISGFAYYDTAKPVAAIQVGTIDATPDKKKGEGDIHRLATLTIATARMLNDRRPDFMILEAPMKVGVERRTTKQTLQGNVEQLSANWLAHGVAHEIFGLLVGLAIERRIPLAYVPPATWRRSFLGFGKRDGWDRPQWKKAARARCDQLRIDVKNSDEAEAVALALCAPNTQEYRKLVRERA